ncbi:MAG: DUF4287 domain-containing protein [Bacteroidia bacterium]
MVDGKLNPQVNATEIANWLNEDFELRHGHAMAIMRHSKEKQNDKNDIKNNEPLTAHWQ